jgi:hypothetical protein
MPQVYYHVSPIPLQIGAKLPNARNGAKSPHNIQQHVNDALDMHAPAMGPKRGTAVYAFDNLVDVAYYRRGTYENGQQSWVYEIDFADDPVRCAWALVQRCNALGQTDPRLPQLSHEYWNPGPQWQLIEYLGVSATVAREVTLASGPVWNLGHDDDAALAKKLWP